MVVLAIALCFVLSPTESFAYRMIRELSRAGASEQGINISAKALDEKRVMVFAEFSPTGTLSSFSHVELDITSGTEKFVSATLKPLEQTSGKVRFVFSTTPEMLSKATLTIVAPQPLGSKNVDGYAIPLDWLKSD
jgi:hypothetical protein